MGDNSQSTDWTSEMEPVAARGFDKDIAPMVSIAISLKRIADAMTGPTNHYGETMTEAVGGEIRRALQWSGR